MSELKILISEKIGFCYGVERAVNKVYELLKDGKKVCIYGELLHNQTMIQKMKKDGIEVMYSLKDISKFLNDDVCVIRAHGIPKNEREILEKNFDLVVDLTCPIVQHVFDFAKDKQKDGFFIIVYGKSEHPEMNALKGNIDENHLIIAKNKHEIPNIKDKKLCVISQTTMNSNEFKAFSAFIVQNLLFSEILIKNTICYETVLREIETAEIASKVDLMLIIGGKNSSNTKKLFNIAKNINPNSFHIQDDNDLKDMDFRAVSSVGISTGTSTPFFAVEKVVNKLCENKKCKIIKNISKLKEQIKKEFLTENF